MTVIILQIIFFVASPIITQLPENVTVLQTESASTNFVCQFTGDPNPTVQWTFIPPPPLTPIPITLTDSYMINTQTIDNFVNSTLTISSITLANAGAYMCTATNGAPIPATGLGILLVVGKNISSV